MPPSLSGIFVSRMVVVPPASQHSASSNPSSLYSALAISVNGEEFIHAFWRTVLPRTLATRTLADRCPNDAGSGCEHGPNGRVCLERL